MKNIQLCSKVKNSKIGVVGLGYVGLPLAVEFSKKFPVIGYDIDEARVADLMLGHDKTNEIITEDLIHLKKMKFTNKSSDLSECNVYIVTVPTPVTSENIPDFSNLTAASRMLGEILTKGDCIVFESTVYPGATEEICIPELESMSGLCCGMDFFVGYSPERINPGDRAHRLPNITKVVAGTCETTAIFLEKLYGQIIDAGVHRAGSIKVAEAAKVIENTQRDVNIALMNDLSKLFFKLQIDTNEVLSAAQTKWNFLPFKPGLVGGHCIGVDPYYLTYKAQSVGHNPDFILSGRRINESVADDIVNRMLEALIRKGGISLETKVLILGCTFKENCPDLRNSKVFDIYEKFSDIGVSADIWDPNVDYENHSMNVNWVEHPANGQYDGIIVAVAHNQFRELGISEIRAFGRPNNVLFDVKALFDSSDSDLRL